jgi:hypothetical protein
MPLFDDQVSERPADDDGNLSRASRRNSLPNLAFGLCSGSARRCSNPDVQAAAGNSPRERVSETGNTPSERPWSPTDASNEET